MVQRSTLKICVSLFLTMIFSVACSAEEAPEINGDTTTQRFGLVSIVYSPHPHRDGDAVQVEATAFFAEYIGLSRDEVLGLVNLRDVPTAASQGIEVGRCDLLINKLSDPFQLAHPNSEISLHFLDAGSVRVGAGGTGFDLQRHSFPRVYKGVAGVSYEGLGNYLDGVPGANTSINVQATGSLHLGPFSASVSTPQLPKLLYLDGRDVTGDEIGMSWDRDVTVLWTVPRRPVNDNEPPVHIELAAFGYDRSVSLHCVVADTGEAVLPRPGLSSMAQHITSDSTVRLTIRRYRQSSFSADGLGRSDLFVTYRDSVLVR
jgi:hypothetical protein